MEEVDEEEEYEMVEYEEKEEEAEEKFRAEEKRNDILEMQLETEEELAQARDSSMVSSHFTLYVVE